MNYSVLMSVYKAETPSSLDASFASLVKQTAPPTELVLVQDGPIGEELQAIVDKYKAKLPIKEVKLEKNVGLGRALATGLNSCACDWVGRMDSDDICVPHRFEKQIEYIEGHPTVSIVGAAIYEFENNLENVFALRRPPAAQIELLRYSKRRSPFNHQTVFFKKKDILNVGSYLEHRWSQDYHLWVRLILSGKEIANIPEVLVYARSGKSLFDRRGGIAYLRNEINIQKDFYRFGHTTLFEFFTNVMIRGVLRVIPGPLRRWFYMSFLRNGVTGS